MGKKWSSNHKTFSSNGFAKVYIPIESPCKKESIGAKIIVVALKLSEIQRKTRFEVRHNIGGGQLKTVGGAAAPPSDKCKG